MKKILIILSGYLKSILTTAWTFRLILISLLVMYLAFWMADQGQDLLVNLNGSDFGVIIFFSAITVNALLYWHLPKYLSTHTQSQAPDSLWGWMKHVFTGSVAYEEKSTTEDEKTSPDKIVYVDDSDLARMFGVATYLIPAFGILNVMDKYGFGPFYAGTYFIITLVVLALVLNFNWIDNLYKDSFRFRMVMHVLLGICLFIMFITWKYNKGTPEDLIYLFWSLCAQALIFFIIVSVRRHVKIPFIKYKTVAPYVMWPGVVLATVFIVLNFLPLLTAETEINTVQYATISILLFGLIFYFIFFSILIFWGRSSNINVALLFVLLAFICAKVIDNRFHDVNTVESRVSSNIRPPDFDAYARQWLLTRKDEIDRYQSTNGGKYPVFIVTAYGGGIRAAAWTSLVIAHIDSMTHTATHGQETFQEHVLAYSGASGGTIGASVMCALRSQGKNNVVTPDSLAHFYQSDFLSPVITGLIGRDFFFSTFGFASYWVELDDRATLQEEIWEYHLNHHFNNDRYSQAFSTCWSDSTYQTPLLFSNSIYVERGVKGIAAPVKLKQRDFPSSVYLCDLIKEREMKLSSASFMSARFPFISPAGRVDSVHHFLDGGIFENSGAETGAEIAGAFDRLLDRDSALMPLRNKIKVVVISLRNSPEQQPEVSYKNLFEVAAPLKALVSKVDGSAIHADSVNAIYFNPKMVGSCALAKSYYRLSPNAITSPDEATVIIPLGWQLSGQALRRLKNSLTYPPTRNRINGILQEMMIKNESAK